MDWSTGARNALDDYCQRVRGDLAAAGYEGADPDEVVEDIRHHVNEDLHALGVTLVTREHVERAVERVGRPVALHGPGPSQDMPRTGDTDSPEIVRPGVQRNGSEPSPTSVDAQGPIGLPAPFFFGVILPLVALMVELGSRMCAGMYFDPVPTVGHAMAIALVPLANAFALFTLHSREPRLYRRAGLLNAAAFVISGYYALVFLPLMPIAAVGILFGGLGFLPLSPFLAMIATLRLRWWLWKVKANAPGGPSGEIEDSKSPPVPGLFVGMALGLGILAAVNAPSSLTTLGLHLATSTQASTSERGIRFLRTVGSESELLERCYGKPQPATGLLALFLNVSSPIPTVETREIFYRVTGRAFNTSPPLDASLNGSWRIASVPFRGGADERGGDRVGARSRGLQLASSRIDAQIDADAAFAYTEWTLSFENRSTWETLEARTLLALPPGGVVSRLTLWVAGEEREAAFAGRSDVRRAYENIVRAQRDPVLVTTAGRDRVLVQCFPVLPDGGTMKIRVGITAPLGITGADGAATRGILRLPSFVERNFAAGEVEHSIWLEAHSPLHAEGLDLTSQQPADDRFALRGQLNDQQLSDSNSLVFVDRDGQRRRAWTPVAGHEDIEQVIRTEPIEPAERIIVVIDGSEGMATHASELAEAIGALPSDVESTVLFAGDRVETAIPLAKPGNRTSAATKLAIERFHFVGGRDATPALVAAFDLALGHDGVRILWVHGAQPVELDSTDTLMQYADRSAGSRILYDMQIAPGPNVIARQLAEKGALLAVPRSAAWEVDLSNLFRVWGTGGERFVIERQPLSPADTDPGAAPASRHLARLWAADEVQRLASERGNAARAAAVALAVEQQLVTSVTGAVVLENEEQYERAGLEAVDAATVPILPEPELILIVTLALLVAIGSFFSRRRGARGVSA